MVLHTFFILTLSSLFKIWVMRLAVTFKLNFDFICPQLKLFVTAMRLIDGLSLSGTIHRLPDLFTEPYNFGSAKYFWIVVFDLLILMAIFLIESPHSWYYLFLNVLQVLTGFHVALFSPRFFQVSKFSKCIKNKN